MNVLRSLGIEIDLSGDADKELSGWIKGLKEASGGADAFAGDLNTLEKEMIQSAKNIGISKKELSELIHQTKKSGEVQAFAKKFGISMDAIKSKSQAASKGVGALGGAVKALAAAGIASQVFGAVSGMTKLAASYEQTAVSFRVLTGSAEKAKEVLKQVDEFSTATPFTPEQVTDASRALINAGMATDDLTSNLQRIGDVASLAGMPIQELASIYSKNMSAGIVQMEDLNQISDRGIPIMRELSKHFFGSPDQVQKVRALSSAGKIGFSDLSKVFSQMTSEGGVAFKMMAEQSETFNGKLSTLTGNVNKIKRAFGETVMKALKPFIEKLNEFASWLAESKPAMMAFSVIMSVVVVTAVVAVTVAFWNMAAAVLAATWPIVLIIAVIGYLVLIVQDIIVGIKGGNSVIFDSVGKWFDKVAEFFKKIWKKIKEFIKNLGKSIKEFGAKLVDWITAPFKKAYKAIKDALGAVWNFLFGDDKDEKKIKVESEKAKEKKKVDGARAGGGPVDAGRTYLVGENGPELFTPTENGAILPRVPMASHPTSVSNAQQTSIVISPVITINGPASQEDGKYLAEVVTKVLNELAGKLSGSVRAGLGLEIV